jgi:ketosteroid isomerase-like protein
MSKENVDLALSVYEAFAKGDINAVLDLLDPKVEWNEAENFIYADGSPYIGPTAVLEGVFKRIGSEWEGFSSSLNEVLDAGETIVVRGYYSGTYSKNGRQVRAQFAHLLTFRNGKIVKFQQYTDTAQFAQVVGINAE